MGYNPYMFQTSVQPDLFTDVQRFGASGGVRITIKDLPYLSDKLCEASVIEALQMQLGIKN